MKKKLTIGSRGSRLALIQSNIVKAKLSSLDKFDIAIEAIETYGDKERSRPITQMGGKGIFVTGVENRLLDGSIDIAVHSLKDMPAVITSKLTIGAYIKAEDNRDVLVSKSGLKLDQLPPKSKIGTGSPRRTAQLKLLRPDLEIVPIRGNVETRIRKVENGEYNAVVLAYAGLKRLGLEDKISQIFSEVEITPAPGQGVIAVEARSDDHEMLDILQKIDCSDQRIISKTEFRILHELGADCTTPIGMSSVLDGNGRICTKLFLANEDGLNYIRKEFRSPL